MQPSLDVRRHGDGSTDFDFYRRRAGLLRRRARTALLRRFLNLAVRLVTAGFSRLLAGRGNRAPGILASTHPAGQFDGASAASLLRDQKATSRRSSGAISKDIVVTRLPATIEEARGCIEYDERGHGPTVVLVPGSCSTGAAWRPVIAQWHDNFRCVTTSLLGYGDTAERRTGFESEISEESEILESVVRRAAGPVHLVGHSFGGLVALDVALRQQVPLLSLTIIEAPAAQLLHNTGEQQHFQTFREMTTEYFAAFYRGDATAIETMIDFYGGDGTFASWPERVRDYALDTTEVNIRDWANVYRFDLTPSRLAAIDLPTLVLFGGQSHPAVQRVNEIIGQCIDDAAIVSIPGAAHFMISTNPGVVARSIAPHVMRAERLRNSAAA